MLWSDRAPREPTPAERLAARHRRAGLLLAAALLLCALLFML
jgi:hypothetical protein